MKRQTFNVLFAAMVFAIMLLLPGSTFAQKKCHNGHCPKGYTCVAGYCVPVSLGCNCSARPIPPECGQYCGFLVDPTNTDQLILVSDLNSVSISLALSEDQQVSLNIYDITGRLIKVLSNDRMAPGEHQIEWNKTDEAGSAVSSGLYIIRLDAGNSDSDRNMLSIIN